MSSLLNETTGACISGTCRTLESPIVRGAVLGIAIGGIICMIIAIVINNLNKTEVIKNGRN